MPALRGLYAITPDALCADPQRLEAAVAAALRGGARLVQYRDKLSDAAGRLQRARRLATLCRAHGVPLVVNDDPLLAAESGAGGVHLGLADATVAAARARLGTGAIVGVTCGNVLARALAAQDAGASYVSFGRFFESRTKPQAPPAEPKVLREAVQSLHLPLCAIGGITPERAPALIAAGASLIAAAGGVFDVPDVETAARHYASLFS
ncbi:MAG TPA: thiamine phosphate synthase [Candidatus Binatia bacterium]|nr:thiamine phosphate synthase [Candidatus Binatia bacterium]